MRKTKRPNQTTRKRVCRFTSKNQELAERCKKLASRTPEWA